MVPQPFRVGDTVRIRTMKQAGVLVEALRNGRFRVAIGAVTTVVSADDLEAAAAGPARQELPDKPLRRVPINAADSVDLHGMRVVEALAALEAWLNAAICAGLDRGQVVHGLGTGKVQEAVHKRLHELKVVKSFQLSQFNPGITLVFF